MQKNIETETNETWNEMAKLLKQNCLKQKDFLRNKIYNYTKDKQGDGQKKSKNETKKKRPNK